jgi:hypothetical protein
MDLTSPGIHFGSAVAHLVDQTQSALAAEIHPAAGLGTLLQNCSVDQDIRSYEQSEEQSWTAEVVAVG